MRVYSNNSIAVAIDMQERLGPSIYNNKEIVNEAIRLIRGLDILGVPLCLTRQYPKEFGNILKKINFIAYERPVYDKTSYSIYDNEKFRIFLKDNDPTSVILFGFELHICITQSAIDLKRAGFQVFVVADASGSRYNKDFNLGIDRLHQENIITIGTESLLFELMRTASHPKYTKIYQLIKQ